MGKQKFGRADLVRMMGEGKSQTEIAEIFGVSKMAVCKAARKLLPGTAQEPTPQRKVSFEGTLVTKPTEEYEDPEEIKTKYENLVAVEAGRLNKHRAYFMEKGENPFGEALQNIVRFYNQFDTIARLNGK